MRGYMFRNRWLALLFVGMVLAGVTRMVGTDQDGGAVSVARDQIVSQHDKVERLGDDQVTTHYVDGPTAESGDIVLEWTPDEELIDPATGYDPTPTDEFAAGYQDDEPVADESQGAIVLQDGGQGP